MALTTLPSAAFASGSVGTGQLADGAVTTEKLVADVNFRNLIINGDMSIAQRSTSVSSVSSSGYKAIDRYRYGAGSDIVNTFSQSTDVPSGQGFKYSFKQEATTGDASLASDQYNIIQTRLEGNMFQSVKFGTSNAESLTLSFWIKASVTGTYICELENVDAGKSQSQSYTVSSANTWEKKTITFSGDTSNAINIDNGRGLDLNWWLGAGTTFSSGTLQTTWGTQTSANRAVGCTNAFASNNNTVFITGVQLEVGTSASDFEFLPYDVNLRRCQRYYHQIGHGLSGASGTVHAGQGQWYSSSELTLALFFPTSMRAKPSMTSPTVSNGYRFHKAGSYQDVSDGGIIDGASNMQTGIYKNGLTGGTGGQATFLTMIASGAAYKFDAEL